MFLALDSIDMSKNTRPPGRPRKGKDGTRVSDFRIPVYVSSEQKARLAATAAVLGRSASDLLSCAFDAFYRVGLTSEQRQAVENLIREE